MVAVVLLSAGTIDAGECSERLQFLQKRPLGPAPLHGAPLVWKLPFSSWRCRRRLGFGNRNLLHVGRLAYVGKYGFFGRLCVQPIAAGRHQRPEQREPGDDPHQGGAPRLRDIPVLAPAQHQQPPPARRTRLSAEPSSRRSCAAVASYARRPPFARRQIGNLSQRSDPRANLGHVVLAARRHRRQFGDLDRSRIDFRRSFDHRRRGGAQCGRFLAPRRGLGYFVLMARLLVTAARCRIARQQLLHVFRDRLANLGMLLGETFFDTRFGNVGGRFDCRSRRPEARPRIRRGGRFSGRRRPRLSEETAESIGVVRPAFLDRLGHSPSARAGSKGEK